MTQPTPSPKHPKAILAKDVWEHLTTVQKAQAHQTLIHICQNLARKMTVVEAKHEQNHSAH